MLLIAVEVRPSAVHGLGVFAREAVHRGAVVWQFDPGVDNRHPVSWLERQPPHVRRFVDIYGVLSLDKTQLGIPGDQTLFINHSSTPIWFPATMSSSMGTAWWWRRETSRSTRS